MESTTSDDAEREQRRCGMRIHADCERLKAKWTELGEQLAEWRTAVTSGLFLSPLMWPAALGKHQELEKALAECQLQLTAAEGEFEGERRVEDLRLEELADARAANDAHADRVDSLR